MRSLANRVIFSSPAFASERMTFALVRADAPPTNAIPFRKSMRLTRERLDGSRRQRQKVGVSNEAGEQPTGAGAGDGPGEESLQDFQRVIERYAEAVNSDKPGEANQAALAALMMAAADAAAHPTPTLLLDMKASALLAARDWEGAENVYRELLVLQEQTGHPGLVAKPQMDLCSLFRLLGRLDEAGRLACAATESARRSELRPLLAMALDSEAQCALEQVDSERALTAAAEALQVIDPGKMGDLMRARAYITLARCQLAVDQADPAEASLQESWRLLANSSHASFGLGPVAALARWFETHAQLHLRKNSLPDAVAALARAVEHRRELLGRLDDSDPYALAALARALDLLAEVRTKTGDLLAAKHAREEGQRIWRELRLPATAVQS